MSEESKESLRGNDFIRTIIQKDRERFGDEFRLQTRFPPEPNGYLHVGHAKSICLNFSLAEEFNGSCHLRFDDTNPIKESEEYVQGIIKDVEWLGYSLKDRVLYASDYFERFYEWALELIDNSKAYVDEQSFEQIRETRGTPTTSGEESPYRERTPQENRNLFERMRAGEFEEGAAVLRAKIDMKSDNINLRDPIIYRIRKIPHQRVGDKWVIYPMYDFAHGFEDAIEGVTHSICTLEFENHRPLYDWFLDNVTLPHRPKQYEFSRLNLTYTVMSKRHLLNFVETNLVDGWNDPRMPTISGMRRRGITSSAIRDFCRAIGVTKVESVVDIEYLFFFIRDELNRSAPRAMVVLDPIKLTITNYPAEKKEFFTGEFHPKNPEMGERKLPFEREIYIERSDFKLDPPKKYFRLGIGREVRLKHAYYVTATEVLYDEKGEISEILCTYDPESYGANTPDGRKVKGTIHWVGASTALSCRVNDYNHLFTRENMNQLEEGKEYKDYLNPDSLVAWHEAKAEPELLSLLPKERFQFMRMGYYFHDKQKSESSEKPVFNRIASLKDGWAKESQKTNQKENQKTK